MTQDLKTRIEAVYALDSRTLSWLPNYEIASNGEVYSLTGWRGIAKRKMAQHPSSHGYMRVSIVLPCGKHKTEFVHKLVCEAFHGEKPTPQHEVRHLDGTRINNDYNNLAWGTRSENAQDRKLHGTERFTDNMRKGGLKRRGIHKTHCIRGHDKEDKLTCPTCTRADRLKWYHENKHKGRK